MEWGRPNLLLAALPRPLHSSEDPNEACSAGFSVRCYIVHNVDTKKRCRLVDFLHWLLIG
jgi:hypothetical protein